MAFAIRRPFATTSIFKQLSKPSGASFRSFHHTPQQPRLSALTSPILSHFKSRYNVFQPAFRGYQQQSFPGYGADSNSGDMKQRLLYGAGIFGATLVAINL